MAGDANRDMEDRLISLLDRVTDWLKFAEAKNTAAVGLSSTALGVIVTFLIAGPAVPSIAGAGLGIGAVMLMLSLMLAVASFLPSTNLEKHLTSRREPPASTDNLLFYGHLARYEPRSLAITIAEHYFGHRGDEAQPSALALDVAEQIVVNAQITVRKLEFFRYSLMLFGFGVLVAAAAMAISAIVI